MFDLTTLLVILITFLVAGAVKGVIGLGLPTVSLAFLTVALDLTSAMALLLVPSFVTNIWQAVVGGNGRVILHRLWPFFLMATIAIGLGSLALTRLDLSWLSALLGALLIAYAVVNLSGFRLTIPSYHESWAGLLMGFVNGIFAGMTGSFVVPGVMFLQAIGLARDVLIQAMGMLFTASTVALALALQNHHLLTLQHGALSIVGLIPALVGMVLGQRIRQRLSEHRFRTVFFVSLLALGAYIIASASRALRLGLSLIHSL